MEPPTLIHNVPLWEKRCRMIHARASDLIEGRFSVIEAARALAKLTSWTGLHADADLTTFVAIDSETDALPVGDVRKLWATHALALHDVAIAEAEALYKPPALEAAHRLVERFAWSLEARAAKRKMGHPT